MFRPHNKMDNTTHDQLNTLEFLAREKNLTKAVLWLKNARAKEPPAPKPEPPILTVYEIEITHTQYNACIKRMKKKPFQAMELTKILIAAGVPAFTQGRFSHNVREHLAPRVADRIIQKNRKNLELITRKPYPTWEWGSKN